MHRLRTDPHPIREALKTSALANAFVNQLQVGANLLPPVAWHPAANSEDANDFLRPHTLGVMFQVKKRVVGKWGLPSEPAAAVGEGKVQTDLGVGKGRYVHRDVMLIGAFEDAATGAMACQVGPEQAVDLITTQGLGRISLGQDVVKNFGDVVQILLQFERVVDAIVAPIIEFLVIQTRIIFKMHAA